MRLQRGSREGVTLSRSVRMADSRARLRLVTDDRLLVTNRLSHPRTPGEELPIHKSYQGENRLL